MCGQEMKRKNNKNQTPLWRRTHHATRQPQTTDSSSSRNTPRHHTEHRTTDNLEGLVCPAPSDHRPVRSPQAAPGLLHSLTTTTTTTDTTTTDTGTQTDSSTDRQHTGSSPVQLQTKANPSNKQMKSLPRQCTATQNQHQHTQTHRQTHTKPIETHIAKRTITRHRHRGTSDASCQMKTTTLPTARCKSARTNKRHINKHKHRGKKERIWGIRERPHRCECEAQ
jgi:hypothetical protein